MNIPNGSRVNLFTSGGAHGGPRVEVVKLAAKQPGEDVETLRLKLQEAKQYLQRLEDEQALNPRRIYAARKPDHQTDDKPGDALSALPSAADIYATRRVSHDS